jgi:hypothetical protein
VSSSHNLLFGASINSFGVLSEEGEEILENIETSRDWAICHDFVHNSSSLVEDIMRVDETGSTTVRTELGINLSAILTSGVTICATGLILIVSTTDATGVGIAA